MERYTCLLIEDDAMAIDMITDYINRRDDLILQGIGTQQSEVRLLIKDITPSIIFLDLIIPPGDSKGFHWGELPSSSFFAVISGIPLNIYKGPLPNGPIFELPKPISFKEFNICVEKIIVEIKNQNCE